MARPTTATEPQSKRSLQVTFATVALKEDAQAYAASRGASLAGLLKMLLVADMKANGWPAAPTA